MYKTVRHGENSLQYKILAQQEEGVSNIKYRKSPRTVTGKLITVIILLIVGIIASAVLVPLVLTNDFIALTGTFQKFSVSTLRRSHSGNHVVVIAKKPFGWNAPHPSAPPRLPNVSLTQSPTPKKSTVGTEPPPATTELSVATKTTKTPFLKVLRNKTTTNSPASIQQRGNPTAETTIESGGRSRKPAEPSSTPSAVQGGAPAGERVSSTSQPVWLVPVRKWGLAPSDNFIGRMNDVVTRPVSVLGSFLFFVVLFIMFCSLRKTLHKRKTFPEKETAETKEHKTRLLKPSVSSDHDED